MNNSKYLIAGASHVNGFNILLEARVLPSISSADFVLGIPAVPLFSMEVKSFIEKNENKVDHIFLFVSDFRYGNYYLNKYTKFETNFVSHNKYDSKYNDNPSDGFSPMQKKLINTKNDELLYQNALQVLDYYQNKYKEKISFIFWDLYVRETFNIENNKYMKNGSYEHPFWNYNDFKNRYVNNTLDIAFFGNKIKEYTFDQQGHPSFKGYYYLWHLLRSKNSNLSFKTTEDYFDTLWNNLFFNKSFKINLTSKIENKNQGFPMVINNKKLFGTVGLITKYIQNANYEKVKEIFSSLLEKDELILEHPLNKNIMTQCRSNILIGDFPVNILFFSDTNQDNKWCLIQAINMIDAIFIDNTLYVYPTFDVLVDMCQNAIKTLINTIRNYEELFLKENKFAGIVLDCRRPQHYFLDHLVDMVQIDKSGKFNNKKILTLDHNFYDLSLLFDNITTSKKENEFYMFPDIIAAQSLLETGYPKHRDILDDMFQAILKTVPGNTYFEKKNYNLVIWIGIAGEKRSWLEQIDGYANVLNELSKYYPTIYAIFDGMTATAGKELNDEGNIKIAEEIMQKVSGNIQHISLAGKDYRTKMTYCRDIDVFISDAGTTALLPYRFYKKPGVLHWSAGDIPLFVETDIHKMVKDEDIKSEEGKALGKASYSMNWKVVYDLTVEILNEIKDMNIQPLKLDEEQKNEEKEKEIFIELQSKFHIHPADILRDIALLFEKKGDIKTALSLMKQALIQRPNGVFIKKKVEFYIKKGEYDECDSAYRDT